MIDTDQFSEVLRRQTIDIAGRRILVSRLDGSAQEPDLTDPTNCGGLGRVRHFTSTTSPGWPANDLPWRPARDYLGPDAVPNSSVRAQVFQTASCNWRCWYCYVPFNLLRADPGRATWVSPGHLVEAYLSLDDRPPVLDLSGGQPDLVPEWSIWTLEELIARGGDASTFLWSDDNLSNDYFFRHLSTSQIRTLADHPGYGRVGCLKGYDQQSFAFNTGAHPSLFQRQWDLLSRLHRVFPRLYLYITLTGPSVPPRAGQLVDQLIDQLAKIDPDLPRRTVPLEIATYGPTSTRMRGPHEAALEVQRTMIEFWNSTMGTRPPDRADHHP